MVFLSFWSAGPGSGRPACIYLVVINATKIGAEAEEN
jgi:hypothetical protein